MELEDLGMKCKITLTCAEAQDFSDWISSNASEDHELPLEIRDAIEKYLGTSVQ